MNLVVPILRHAAEQPDRIALTHDQATHTYATLVQAMRRIANGLQQRALGMTKSLFYLRIALNLSRFSWGLFMQAVFPFL